MNFTAGTQLYKYTLKRKIGGGNFGEVWLAHDATVSTDVAIKLLDETIAPATMNLKEAQLGNRLNHQNVVKVHYADVVDVGGTNVVVIAMDHHVNGSIVAKVNPGNFIIATQVVSFITDVLRGLEYLHEQSLFHNDIKPSNILLGSKNEALLTDYGISCSSPGLLPANAPNAYILHRAPETANTNTIAVTTDIYQVGLTLFRLLNGIGLIKDLCARLSLDDFEKLKVQGKIPPPDLYLPFVTPAMKRIISKATNPNPIQRFQSALEMRRALERIVMFGHWDMTATGDLFGVLKNNIYTYGNSKSKLGHELVAYRENQDSGRRTKIVKFSKKGLTERECGNLKKSYMLAVVNGDI
jgi:eukaryotic-like serine/threonine-protein kinase